MDMRYMTSVIFAQIQSRALTTQSFNLNDTVLTKIVYNKYIPSNILNMHLQGVKGMGVNNWEISSPLIVQGSWRKTPDHFIQN